MELRKIKINKKASVVDIILWIVIAFVTVTFLALWTYGFDKLTTAMTDIGTSGNINITKHAEATFGVVNSKMSGLQAIAFIIIFMLAFSILITNFFIKAHPIFFPVYIFIIIIAVILAVNVSNVYEESLMGHPEFGSTFQEFDGASFIMLNLPLWVVVMGFLGAIFLFIGISRDRELGGGVV